MPHSAFELIQTFDLSEFKASGLLFRHKKTGMEVFHIKNDDSENLFAFAFRTIPSDATGVAHILEHSVLCGSKQFPLKDAFISASQGSLNTFMNALTFPDRTVYPAASIVEADYFNLMAVYADAVFFPLLKPEVFLQEGHRLVPGENGQGEIQGVVYSEMQGAYSSPEGILDEKAFRSLFDPGHPYSYDSGGDPQVIPRLSYQDFLAFHSRHYQPSNCRLFLYGDIDSQKQLDFLESRFLSSFSATEPVPPLPLQAAFREPRRLEVPYPCEAEGGKTSILINWLCADASDPVESLSLEILGEILIGHDGSPLGRALRESGLGEDIAPQTGLSTEIRQAIFSAGLRGIEKKDAGAVEELIFSCLKALRDEGIGQDLLDSAIKAVEFSNREIRRGGGPYSIRLMRRCMRGWIHGKSPDSSLRYLPAMEEVKRRLADKPRYFEELLDRALISNPHRSTVMAVPDPELGARQKKRLEEEIAARLASMSTPERKQLDDSLVALAAFHATPDSAEDLEKMPWLRAQDLPTKVESIERQELESCGVPLLAHPLFTNGISYLEFTLDIEALPSELLPWLPLYARFLTTAGIPGTPYHQMNARMAAVCGGFSCILETASAVNSDTRSQSSRYAVLRLKALDTSFGPALDCVWDLLSKADCSDHGRIRDVFNELRNDVQAALAPSGHAFAQTRGQSSFSASSALEEVWRGISQHDFLQGLGKEIDIGLIAARFEEIGQFLRSSCPRRASLSCDDSAMTDSLAKFGEFCARFPALKQAQKNASAPNVPRAHSIPKALDEGFSIQSEVGYAALNLPSVRLGHPLYASLSVLSTLISSTYLWEEIRMKRGAYGAWAACDPMEGVFSFVSYRDPSALESLGLFKKCLEKFACEPCEAKAVEKALVGTVASDLRPLTPEEKGLIDLRRGIFGISDELRQKKRDELLKVSPKSLREAAQFLLDGWAGKVQTIVAGTVEIDSAVQNLSGLKRRDLA